METNTIYWVPNKCNMILSLLLLTLIQPPLVLGDQISLNSPTNPPVISNDPHIKDYLDNPIESPRKFERYVKDKYKDIREMTLRVNQTSHGPSKEVFILGKIVPHKKPSIDMKAEPDRHVRVRAIAKAFMDDENALLGITPSEEIRETHISTGKGFGGDHTIIHYKRYINGIELDDANIIITIGPDENIQSISAGIVPVIPEVYEATKKTTLSKEEITSIIEADISDQERSSIDINNIIKSFNKIALNYYPYIIWKVSYIYDYTIDAFTGKILTKDSGIAPPFKMQQPPSLTVPSNIPSIDPVSP